MIDRSSHTERPLGDSPTKRQRLPEAQPDDTPEVSLQRARRSGFLRAWVVRAAADEIGDGVERAIREYPIRRTEPRSVYIKQLQMHARVVDGGICFFAYKNGTLPIEINCRRLEPDTVRLLQHLLDNPTDTVIE